MNAASEKTYTVVLKDTLTGETKRLEQQGDWQEQGWYLWTMGNYSCDCNRSLFFYGYGVGDARVSPCDDGIHRRFELVEPAE